MLELDFDQVMGVQHGWLGEMVRVGGSVTAQHLRGHLGAGSDMHDPEDEAESGFAVGDDGGFAIHRDYFAGANLFPDSERTPRRTSSTDSAPSAVCERPLGPGTPIIHSYAWPLR